MKHNNLVYDMCGVFLFSGPADAVAVERGKGLLTEVTIQLSDLLVIPDSVCYSV